MCCLGPASLTMYHKHSLMSIHVPLGYGGNRACILCGQTFKLIPVHMLLAGATNYHWNDTTGHYLHKVLYITIWIQTNICTVMNMDIIVSSCKLNTPSNKTDNNKTKNKILHIQYSFNSLFLFPHVI